MANYINLENLLADNYPNATKQAEKDAIARLIPAASRAVDRFTNRPTNYFAAKESDDPEADPLVYTAKARKFYGSGNWFLQVDPFASDISDVVIEVPDGYNAPLFESYQHGVEVGLRIVDAKGFPTNELWYAGFPYSVTAVFGFGAVPEDVQEAVRQIILAWRPPQAKVLGSTEPGEFDGQLIMPQGAIDLLTPWIVGRKANYGSLKINRSPDNEFF